MDKAFLRWLTKIIADGQEHRFYTCRAWLSVRDKVLDMDRHECQIHKARGRYKRADLVHHINHLKDAPDLALSIWYKDAGGQRQRNLISVCKDCHETECHPERLRKYKPKPTVTRERWD